MWVRWVPISAADIPSIKGRISSNTFRSLLFVTDIVHVWDYSLTRVCLNTSDIIYFTCYLCDFFTPCHAVHLLTTLNKTFI